jgi:four helix bundle protein
MERKYTNGFRKLIAWKEAKLLTVKIYTLTKKFPLHEQSNLISQLRRAASSSMANIAEGSAMPTKAHRQSFYMRARGSAVEVDNFAELSFELHYLSEKEASDVTDHVARLSYLLTKLMQADH